VPADGRAPIVVSGRSLRGEDLADLTCGVVRVPVEHRLQVVPLRVRTVSGQLTFQFHALRAGSAGEQRGGDQQQEPGQEKEANVVFTPIRDRLGHRILSVRDQNTFDEKLRQKRLMTLIHLYLVHRYKADVVHYVSPTDDNQYQAAKMRSHGIFSEVNTDIGQIIVADVDAARTAELLNPDRVRLGKLIRKEA